MPLSTKKSKWESRITFIILAVVSIASIIVDAPLNQPFFWKMMSYALSIVPACAVCIVIVFIMHLIGQYLNMAIHRKNKRNWLWLCIPVILLVGTYVALTVVMRERMDLEMGLIAEHGLTSFRSQMPELSFDWAIDILKEDLVMFILAYTMYLVPVLYELWRGIPATRTEKKIMKSIADDILETRSEADSYEKQILGIEDEMNTELEQVDTNYGKYFGTFQNNPYKLELDNVDSKIALKKQDLDNIEKEFSNIRVVWKSVIQEQLLSDYTKRKIFVSQFQQIFPTKTHRDEIFSL